MSLDKFGKNSPKLNRNTMKEMRSKSNLLLVLMLFFQLVLPVMAVAGNSSTENDAIEPNVVEVQSLEEELDADIESPKSLDAMNEDIGEDIEEAVEVDEKDSSAVEEKEKKPVEEVKKPVEKEKQPENKAPPAKEEEKVEEKENPKPELKETENKTEEKAELEEEPKLEEKEAPVEVIEEAEIPDPMLDGFPGRPYDGPPVLIKQFAAGSLGAAIPILQGSQMMQRATQNELQPGEVRTNKTATPVPGMVNTWDIKVRIEGRDDIKVETTDVVLVIDRSGSMADQDNGWFTPTRLEYAKTAANNFINTMIPADPNLRIAIVSFAENVSVNRQFTRTITGTNGLRTAVNGLSASGGTHTQAGVLQGRALLNGSTADNKFVVLLSDGQPTYSYEPNNWTQTYDGSWPGLTGSGSRTNYFGVYDGNYSSNVVGTGNALTESYNATGNRRRHIHNGLAAIRAGQDSRQGINAIFTIAVNAGAEGTPILQQIANPGLAYSTSNPSELEEIYDMIGQQISTQYALKFPTVVDEMGDGFTLIESSLAKSEGVTSVTPATGSKNQVINWDISPTVTKLVPGSTNVRYAEMTYRVEINDDILDLPDAKTNDDKLFKTNKSTVLNYLDANDDNATINITSPEVDPVLLRVKKNLINGSPDETRRFRVQISGSGNYSEAVNLVPNGDYLWLTTLRHEGAYSVEEINVIGTPATPLSQFMISYEVDGASTTGFNVYHTGATPRGDVVIDVTNREIRKIDITGTKVWQGGPERKPNVMLQLYRNGVAHRAPITLNHPTTTHTWTNLDEIDSNGGAYTYTVKEVNPPEGYQSSANGLTVTNIYQIPSDGSATAIKVWEGSKPDDFSAIPLTLWRTLDGVTFEQVPNVSPTISQDPIVNPNEQTYRYVWDELAETDFYGNPYTFYFTENEEVDGYDRSYLDTTTTGTINGALMTFALSGGRVRNREMNLNFTFVKVDEVGDALPGAVFDLHKHDGTNRVLVERLGDGSPISTFNFTGLTQGTYTLTEVSVPDGYILPDDNTWTFEVVWNDAEKKLEIVFATGDDIDGEIANYPIGLLPDTGGPGSHLYLIVSMISLLSLGTIYVWRNQRDEVNQND